MEQRKTTFVRDGDRNWEKEKGRRDEVGKCHRIFGCTCRPTKKNASRLYIKDGDRRHSRENDRPLGKGLGDRRDDPGHQEHRRGSTPRPKSSSPKPPGSKKQSKSSSERKEGGGGGKNVVGGEDYQVRQFN